MLKIRDILYLVAGFVAGFALYFLLHTNRAHAETPIPANQGRITDLAGKLSESDKAKVAKNLSLFETSRNDKPQFVVLILKDLPDEGIEDFTRKVFNAWGVGQSEAKNGLLWVWVPSSRKYRLEVGRGLEGAIPDVESFRAQESIKTLLRQDRGADAIIALSDRLRGDLDPDTAIREQRASGLGIFAGVIAFLAALFAALIAFVNRKKSGPLNTPTPVVKLSPEEQYRQASQPIRPARTYPGPSAPPRPTTLKAPPAPSPTPKSSSSSRASDIATGAILGSILSSGSSSGSSSSSSSSSSSDNSYSGGGGSSDGGGSSGDY